MSVLIKGMDMPTACSKCDCGNGDYGFCQITRDSWWHIDPSTDRMENCPLVHIPDHGDLIDRDTLNDAMYHEAFETDSDMQRWDSGCWIRYKMFDKHRNLAPVIIPAERSEDAAN